jgi:hypothetical protein
VLCSGYRAASKLKIWLSEPRSSWLEFSVSSLERHYDVMVFGWMFPDFQRVIE